MDFLKALGSRVAKLTMLFGAAKEFVEKHWWNVGVGAIAGVLIFLGIESHAEIADWLLAFIATPAGGSMLLNLIYLAIGFVVLRLIIVWANHSSVTGEEFEVHLAFDKIFNDARASADLLGKLAIACAIVVFAFARG